MGQHPLPSRTRRARLRAVRAVAREVARVVVRAVRGVARVVRVARGVARGGAAPVVVGDVDVLGLQELQRVEASEEGLR